jgi:hypothetical protein
MSANIVNEATKPYILIFHINLMLFFHTLSFIIPNKSPIIFMTISEDIMNLIPGAGNPSVSFGAQEDYILSIDSGKLRSSATSFFPKHLFLPLLLPSRFMRFFIHNKQVCAGEPIDQSPTTELEPELEHA